MLFIMDVYLRDLYEQIFVDISDKTYICIDEEEYPRCSDGLSTLVQKIESRNDMMFIFNKEGRLHSQYLNDGYEPAITLHNRNRSIYYYLFDGEIKDCIHPFAVEITNYNHPLDVEIYITEKNITYYSSERIKQELPMKITEDETTVFETYNQYSLEPLIKGYKSGSVEINIAGCIKQNYFLHDCMEQALLFKFAD